LGKADTVIRLISQWDDFRRVYAHFVPAHFLVSPLHLLADQHTISPAHARIYSLGLATQRNHCSNIDLSSFIHPHSNPCRNHPCLYRTRLPIHVHNYSHPYCLITVYRSSLSLSHSAPFLLGHRIFVLPALSRLLFSIRTFHARVCVRYSSFCECVAFWYMILTLVFWL